MRTCGIISLLLASWSVSLAYSESPGEDEPSGEPLLTVQVVDLQGRPVEGASLGNRFVSTNVLEPPNLYGLGDPEQQQLTDDRGEFPLHDRKIAARLNDREVIVCVYHHKRELIAIDRLTAQDLGTTKQITVVPGRKVTAHITSSELERLGRPIWLRKFLVFWDGTRCGYMQSRQSQVPLVLPPGEYRIMVYSEPIALPVEHDFVVATGETKREIAVDLPASPLGRMVGKPAADLRIKEWKNGGPLTFADLRGKVVLLDFWGYWCGPCLHRMPHLFELHEQHKEQGLVIIAIHDDSVPSIAELGEKLVDVRKEIWDGKDLPFLVALDGGGKTKIAGTDYEVDGATSAAYGIMAWPTNVLINRNGIVVGPVDPSTEDGRATIERLLRRESDHGAE